jgi:hypothetical protein
MWAHSHYLFMGGLSEAHAPRAAVGPTVQAIFAKAVSSSASGRPLFLDLRGRQENCPSDRSTQLSDIIKRAE